MEINALVVDDSGVMRKMVMRNLIESRTAQSTFTEAKDGADALEKFDPKHTDIVFLGWNIPNMSGIEAVRNILVQTKTTYPIGKGGEQYD
jgi:chemotaxis response regulator CheB